MEIKLKNGDAFTFEEFELKESNLRKINIDWDGEDSEGLWAYFDDEGVKQYDSDAPNGNAIVALANAPICFYPHNFWGAFMPVVFRGSNRAYVNLSNLTGTPIFHSDATKESE